MYSLSLNLRLNVDLNSRQIASRVRGVRQRRRDGNVGLARARAVLAQLLL